MTDSAMPPLLPPRHPPSDPPKAPASAATRAELHHLTTRVERLELENDVEEKRYKQMAAVVSDLRFQINRQLELLASSARTASEANQRIEDKVDAFVRASQAQGLAREERATQTDAAHATELASHRLLIEQKTLADEARDKRIYALTLAVTWRVFLCTLAYLITSRFLR